MATATPVDRLEPGDHACLTFSDPEERLDLLAAFVADGLSRGDRVICYSDDVEDLRDQLQDRTNAAVRVERTDQLWDDTGPDAKRMVERLAGEVDAAVGPDAKRVVERLAGEVDAAVGPDAKRVVERLAGEVDADATGLRITLDMCWAARPQANAEQLLAFESEVGKLFATGRLTAICEYDRESFDPVTLAYAARVHRRTVAAAVYHEDPVLRICRQHVPPGVRVAGELDFSRAEALGDALAEAVRLDRDVHLNLNQLRFLDAGAAAVILRTAAGLPASRRMVVICSEPIERILTVAGAADVAALRMLVRHAER